MHIPEGPWPRLIEDPRVCDGEPTVRGTRIPVRVVLDNLAAGLEIDALLAEHPTLDREDVQEAMRWADATRPPVGRSR